VEVSISRNVRLIGEDGNVEVEGDTTGEPRVAPIKGGVGGGSAESQPQQHPLRKSVSEFNFNDVHLLT